MMTYAMARWYQLEKTCGTPIFIFITHIVTMPVQYLMILNFIIRSIQSSTSIAFSAPDNLFISHHNYLLHGYQLYPRCDYTFIPDLMSYTLNFILPCLHSLTVTSLSCGNLDPGKTCPNPGPTTTTSICWRDLFFAKWGISILIWDPERHRIGHSIPNHKKSDLPLSHYK